MSDHLAVMLDVIAHATLQEGSKHQPRNEKQGAKRLHWDSEVPAFCAGSRIDLEEGGRECRVEMRLRRDLFREDNPNLEDDEYAYFRKRTDEEIAEEGAVWSPPPPLPPLIVCITRLFVRALALIFLAFSRYVSS